MPRTEEQEIIRNALPGIKSGFIIPGFFDNKAKVLGPHVQAASTISDAGIPTEVHVVGHHQGRGMQENLNPVITEMRNRAQKGPFVIFASSAGSIYPLLAATYIPEDELENLAGAVLLSPRVNSSASLEKAEELSPAYPPAVKLFEARWEDVSPSVQGKFAITRHTGDTTVPWTASELKDARMYDSESSETHQDNINRRLTTDLPETVRLALAA